MTNYITDCVSKDLEPIHRAEKLQQEAAKYGFDWVRSLHIIKKIEEELHEVEAVLDDRIKLAEE